MRRYKRIPEELKAVAHWVTHGASGKGLASLKKPYNPTTGKDAKVNDPGTWATFAECEEAVRKVKYSGLGFVFTGDYIVIDLDGVIDAKGSLLPLAAEIIEAVDSYTEKSLSGRGFHIIARKPSGLTLGANKSRIERLQLDPATLARFTRTELNRKTGELREKKPEVEIYDIGRYVAITGDVWQGRDTIRDAPEALESVYNALIAPTGNQQQAATVEAVTEPYTKPQEAVSGDLDRVRARMFRGRNREQITKLWRGDCSDWKSESEAALRLCDHLAFYTDKNPAQMAALFRQSGLYRPKCDEARAGGSWLDCVIAKAIAKDMVTYSDYVQGRRSHSRAL